LFFFFAIRHVRQHVRNRDGEEMKRPSGADLPLHITNEQPTSASSFIQQDGLLAQNNAAIAGEKARAVTPNVP
jgi:hypothetical protein